MISAITFKNRILVILSEQYFTSPLNLYIGDNNSTSIFEQASSRQQIIGVLFTNKLCRQCHLNEGQMLRIILRLWKECSIKVYRVQLSVNKALQEEFNIKRFPMLHFVIPNINSYSIYTNYGIVNAKSTKQIGLKLQVQLKRQNTSQQQSQQAIYIDMDKLLFLDETELIELYSFNPVYLNLPALKFADHRQLNKILSKNKINDYELSNCQIYLENENKCYSPSSVQQVAYLFSLINYEKTIQFTQQTYKAYQQLEFNRYIFIAVLDSIFDREGSQLHIQMLNKLLISRQFRGKITIFWMEVQINKQKLAHLGFQQTNRPPLFSQFDLTNAPKKTLINKNGPVFNQRSIINFIKNILNFDQKQELMKSNYQLLQQSLLSLKINDQFRLVSLKQIRKQVSYFILALPYIQFQLLAHNHAFYRMILSYRYLVERINRFIQNKINVNYLTFDQFQCTNKLSYGLFLIKQEKCDQISSNIIINQEEISYKIKQIFNLPDFYWINQDELEEYLLESSPQVKLKPFTYHYIDI